MRNTTLLLILATSLWFVPQASGQTKISGTMQCSISPAPAPLEIGDRPGHTLGVEQFHCTWTKPLEIAGLMSGNLVTTGTVEARPNHVRERGYDVIEWPGGAKTVDRYFGSAVTSEGKLVSGRGRWRFTHGTGKLAGIKGGGTYTYKVAASGVTCDVEGDYTLPAK